MSRMKSLALLAVLLLFGFSLVAARADKGEKAGVNKAAVQNARITKVPPRPWAADGLWDDGQAEFAQYQVSWHRYGKHYPGEATLILVKEPWNPEQEVKADTPHPKGFDVIKLNHIRSVQTGIYTYQQMASAFLPRKGGGLRKLTTTSAEACGQTTAVMTDHELRTFGYFEGQGEQTHPWPKGVLSEDALALQLRDFVSGKTPQTLSIMPSLLTGKLPAIKPATWTVQRKSGVPVKVAAGEFQTVSLSLLSEGRRLNFWFGRSAPHVLVKFEEGFAGNRKGTSYELQKVERIPYWEMNNPGEERWYGQD